MYRDKMNEALQVYLAHASAEDMVPVLVTTRAPVLNTAAFEVAGLHVSRQIGSIPLLSGKIQAQHMEQLLDMKEVEKVELDSEISLDHD